MRTDIIPLIRVVSLGLLIITRLACEHVLNNVKRVYGLSNVIPKLVTYSLLNILTVSLTTTQRMVYFTGKPATVVVSIFKNTPVPEIL